MALCRECVEEATIRFRQVLWHMIDVMLRPPHTQDSKEASESKLKDTGQEEEIRQKVMTSEMKLAEKIRQKVMTSEMKLGAKKLNVQLSAPTCWHYGVRSSSGNPETDLEKEESAGARSLQALDLENKLNVRSLMEEVDPMKVVDPQEYLKEQVFYRWGLKNFSPKGSLCTGGTFARETPVSVSHLQMRRSSSTGPPWLRPRG